MTPRARLAAPAGPVSLERLAGSSTCCGWSRFGGGRWPRGRGGGREGRERTARRRADGRAGDDGAGRRGVGPGRGRGGGARRLVPAVAVGGFLCRDPPATLQPAAPWITTGVAAAGTAFPRTLGPYLVLPACFSAPGGVLQGGGGAAPLVRVALAGAAVRLPLAYAFAVPAGPGRGSWAYPRRWPSPQGCGARP